MSIASTRRRLMEEKLKVGDQVTIRQWDDMLKEYGYRGDTNNINAFLTFTQDMAPNCGQTYQIISVFQHYQGRRKKFKIATLGKYSYNIGGIFSTDMFELIPGDGYAPSLREALAPDNKFTVDLI